MPENRSSQRCKECNDDGCVQNVLLICMIYWNSKALFFLQNVAKLCYKSSTIIIKCKTILNLYNNTDNIVIKIMWAILHEQNHQSYWNIKRQHTDIYCTSTETAEDKKYSHTTRKFRTKKNVILCMKCQRDVVYLTINIYIQHAYS